MLPMEGDEQDHGDDRPPVEVGDAAQHLVVEEGGDDLIAAAHRGGDAEVGEAQEEGLNEGARQSSQQGAKNGDPEGGQVPVPHGLGDNDGLFVHKTHGVVDQQEGHRNGIDHIAHQQPAEAVDVKELPSQQAGEQPLSAEGVDDGKAIGDGGQEHGQGRDGGDEPLGPPGQSGVVDRIGHQEGDDRGRHGRCGRHRKAVAKGREKSLPGHHRGIELPGKSALPHQGLAQQQEDGGGQEAHEQKGDDPENPLQLPIFPSHGPFLKQPRRPAAGGRRTGRRCCRA